MSDIVVATERLVLRRWRQADVAPFHAMGRDPEVMRWLGAAATPADAQATHDRMVACEAAHGLCFWAVERRADGAFIGFCGLKPGGAPIEGEVEIGWRLARAAWGRGLAFEAAMASLAWGWANTDVAGIAAMTVPGNRRSRQLMERIGMRRCAGEDFDHPALAPGDPLRRHLLYRVRRPAG